MNKTQRRVVHGANRFNGINLQIGRVLRFGDAVKKKNFTKEHKYCDNCKATTPTEPRILWNINLARMVQ